MVWSASACVCARYPAAWALPWVTAAEGEREAVRAQLGLDPAALAALQGQVDAAFADEQFGWPDVWLDLPSARAFYRQYLTAMPHVKLLAIGLPAGYRAGYLAEKAPALGMGACGIYLALQAGKQMPPGGKVRGYEVLGGDQGDHHSFLCNQLEVPYRQELNIELNEHGLISEYADAVRAAEYTNLPTTGAEPVTWRPWRIVEYSPLPHLA
jgi:hypothetical protein